ncbi:MAG: GNAT family protein [Anaeromyxobacter sp.]
MTGPFLVGEKVSLRPLDATDAPRLVTLLNDPAVRRNLRLDRPVSLAAEHEFIAALARATDQVVLGVAARDDGRLLGVTGLHQLGDAARQAEFGIFLGGPQEWGKGFGQEATRLIVDYGFGTLNLNRIWLHVNAGNQRGVRAYQKVGFKTEGVLRQASFRDGAYQDVVAMAILREEWAPPGRPG